MAVILTGKPVADALSADTARRAGALRQRGVSPRLVILRCGENEADGAYIRGAVKRGALCGVEVELRALPADATAADVREAIREIKALAIHYTRADESRIFAMLDDVPELKEALTDREREVAQLAAGGMRNSEIAETLHISENTVKHHLKNAFQKMNIDRRSRLIEMLR